MTNSNGSKRPISVRPVDATLVKNKFGVMLKAVHEDREHLIVKKSGLSIAVLIPIDDYRNAFPSQDTKKSAG